MAPVWGSSDQSIRSLVPAPATRSSEAAIWRGVVVSAGRFIAVRLPHEASLASAASMMPCKVRRGEHSATGVPGGTGHTERLPASGSRMIPDRKLDAAALGLPGRTDTVIKRTDRP